MKHLDSLGKPEWLQVMSHATEARGTLANSKIIEQKGQERKGDANGLWQSPVIIF